MLFHSFKIFLVIMMLHTLKKFNLHEIPFSQLLILLIKYCWQTVFTVN